jgi:gluconate 2-dehydrogenase gamma chain
MDKRDNDFDVKCESQTASRRGFLKALGTLPALSTPAIATVCAASFATESAHATQSALVSESALPVASSRDAYVFFSPAQSKAIEAIVNCLIPSDALGGGALEAGVAFYIDYQLGGAYGNMGRAYRSGPWFKGTAQQGYQSALTPAEYYGLGLLDLESYCQKTEKKSFADLSIDKQNQILQLLERDVVSFENVSSKQFFELVYANCMEGFFADPIYGGNRNKIGWQMVGYPGAAAAYLGVIEQHGKPYRVIPVSLADMQSGRADNDGVGHAIHEPVTKQGGV